MRQGGSRLNSHSELILSLQKQLEATERELANQKWVFEQFLQSPSWKITSPLRWLAGRARAARVLFGGAPPARSNGNHGAAEAVQAGPEADVPLQLKDIFAEYYSIQLRSLLSAGGELTLPNA